jgi:hypothetical protein
VQAKVDGELRPLVEIHAERLRKIPGYNFKLNPEFIVANRSQIAEMLKVLLLKASQQNNSARALQELISHAVSSDGIVQKCTLRRYGESYWLNDYSYLSLDLLVETALDLFESVAEPKAFFKKIDQLPPLIPVLNVRFVRLLSAIFMTHLPDQKITLAKKQPINVHLHWGGRDMAGFPPYRKGYFGEQTKVRTYKSIMDTLMSHFPDLSPLCFVLLPAPAFMLCPSDAHPADIYLLNDLFRKVHESNVLSDEVCRTWLNENYGRLSPYFRSRFVSGDVGFLDAKDRPSASKIIEPDGFRDLSFQQACTIVGEIGQFQRN